MAAPSHMSAARPRARASLQPTVDHPSSYDLFMRRLPTDLVLRILDFLCIADIHCLRRAGAGAGPDADLHALLRAVMRRRVRRLQGIWSAMTLEDVDKNFLKFLPRGWPQPEAQDRVLTLLRDGVPKQDPDDFLLRYRRNMTARLWPPRPTYVSKMSDILHLSFIHADAANAIAHEMPDLVRLNSHSTTELAELSPWGPFRDVPPELGRCTQLRALELSGTFEEIAEPILQLSGLVDLVFGWDCQIKALPDNIGVRLPNLRFVELQGCPLSSLPRSLLDAVERNRFRKWPKLPGGYGIIVSEHHFPPGYWAQILGKDRPPRYPPPSRAKKGLVFRADP